MDSGPILSRSEDTMSALARTERLAYLADMLSELQAIAAREGCATLSGLISLSHAEAQRQVSGARKPA